MEGNTFMLILNFRKRAMIGERVGSQVTQNLNHRTKNSVSRTISSETFLMKFQKPSFCEIFIVYKYQLSLMIKTIIFHFTSNMRIFLPRI